MADQQPSFASMLKGVRRRSYEEEEDSAGDEVENNRSFEAPSEGTANPGGQYEATTTLTGIGGNSNANAKAHAAAIVNSEGDAVAAATAYASHYAYNDDEEEEERVFKNGFDVAGTKISAKHDSIIKNRDDEGNTKASGGAYDPTGQGGSYVDEAFDEDNTFGDGAQPNESAHMWLFTTPQKQARDRTTTPTTSGGFNNNNSNKGQDAHAQSTSHGTASTSQVSVAGTIVSFLPSPELILSVKFVNRRFHALASQILKLRLVRAIFAPPVQPLTLKNQLELARPLSLRVGGERKRVFGEENAQAAPRVGRKGRSRSRSRSVGSRSSSPQSPLLRDEEIYPSDRSPSNRGAEGERSAKSPTGINWYAPERYSLPANAALSASSSSSKLQLSKEALETLAALQSHNAAKILSKISGDVFELVDCTVVRYDRELLDIAAWCSLTLSSCESVGGDCDDESFAGGRRANSLLRVTPDTPSYFFVDLARVRQGFIVEGVVAGPVCQLLMPASQDRQRAPVADEEDLGHAHRSTLTRGSSTRRAKSVPTATSEERGNGPRSNSPQRSVSTESSTALGRGKSLAKINKRKNREECAAVTSSLTSSSLYSGVEKQYHDLLRQARKGPKRATSPAARSGSVPHPPSVKGHGLRIAKITGLFYVGTAGSRKGGEHSSVDVSRLPFLYKGTALLAVDQPYAYTALATGTAITTASTVNLATPGRFLSASAPRAHTHAELSFGNAMVISRRVSAPATSKRQNRKGGQQTNNIVFRQVVQGCLYVETHSYAAVGGGGEVTLTQRTAFSSSSSANDANTFSTAFVAAKNAVNFMAGDVSGSGAAIASARNAALVARHALACVPPPSSFSYTCGEISTLCSHVTKASEKVSVLGFSPFPLLPLPKGGSLFAAPSRGLQSHLRDLVNSAVRPPPPTISDNAALSPLTVKSPSSTLSLGMLEKVAACYGEGVPADVCSPQEWAFPVAVMVEGFAAPSLFLPPTPLNTPVTMIRQLINDLTTVANGQTEGVKGDKGNRGKSSLLPPLSSGASRSAADESKTDSVVGEPLSTATLSSSWLPTGPDFTFKVFGNAALCALAEVTRREKSRGRLGYDEGEADFDSTNATLTYSSTDAISTARKDSKSLPLPEAFEEEGIPIAMSSSPLTGPNVDYTDAEDALTADGGRSWVHVPNRTRPFSVSLMDLLPFGRDGAFTTSQLLNASPSVLQSRGAVGGGWPQGVSGIADRALVIVITPTSSASSVPSREGAAADSAGFGLGNSAVDRARRLRQRSYNDQQQQDLFGDGGAAGDDLMSSSPPSMSNARRGSTASGGRTPPSPSSQLLPPPSATGATTSPRPSSSAVAFSSSLNVLARYTAAYSLAADCCRLGDVATLKALFNWTNDTTDGTAITLSGASGKGKGRGVAPSSSFSSSRLALLNVNDRGAVGISLLHIACEHGKRDVIAFLLSLGASIFLPNGSGKLPIHICAEKGHAECLPLLLKGSFLWPASAALQTLSAQDHAGRTPLHSCLNMRYTNTALWLVEQGADVATITDAAGDTVADVACRLHSTVADLCRSGDHRGTVMALLAATMDIAEYSAELRAATAANTAPPSPSSTHQTSPNRRQFSSFDAAADTSVERQLSNFYVEVLKHKLTDGRLVADVYGKVTVHSKRGALIENITGNTCLHEAVLCGQASVVHAVLFHPRLASFIDLFSENAAGDTILHAAAGCGNHELVQMILTAAATMGAARYDSSSSSPSASASAGKEYITVLDDNNNTTATDPTTKRRRRSTATVVACRPRRKSMYDTTTTTKEGHLEDKDGLEEVTTTPPILVDSAAKRSDGDNEEEESQENPHDTVEATGSSGYGYESLALTDVLDLLQWRNIRGQTVLHLLFARRQFHTVRWLLQWICGGCGCSSYSSSSSFTENNDEYAAALAEDATAAFTQHARKLLAQIPDAQGLTALHYALDVLLKPSSVFEPVIDVHRAVTQSSKSADPSSSPSTPSNMGDSSSNSGYAPIVTSNEEFAKELILFALPTAVPYAMPNCSPEDEQRMCEALLLLSSPSALSYLDEEEREHPLDGTIPRGGNAEKSHSPSNCSSPRHSPRANPEQRIELPPVAYTTFSPLRVAFEARFGYKIRAWEQQQRQQQRREWQTGVFRPSSSTSVVTILDLLVKKGSPSLLDWYLTTMRTSVTIAVVSHLRGGLLGEENCGASRQNTRQRNNNNHFNRGENGAEEDRRDFYDSIKETPRPDDNDENYDEEEVSIISKIIIPSSSSPNNKDGTSSYNKTTTRTSHRMSPQAIRAAVNNHWPIAIFGLSSDRPKENGECGEGGRASSTSPRHVLIGSNRSLFLCALHCGSAEKLRLISEAFRHADAFSLPEDDGANKYEDNDDRGEKEPLPTAHRAGLFIVNELLRPRLLLENNTDSSSSSSLPLDTSASAASLSSSLYQLITRCRSTKAIDTVLCAFGPCAVVRAVGVHDEEEAVGAFNQRMRGERGHYRLLRLLIDEHAALCNELESSATRHVPPTPTVQPRPGHVYSSPVFKTVERKNKQGVVNITLANASYTARLGEMPGVGEGPNDTLSAKIQSIKKGVVSFENNNSGIDNSRSVIYGDYAPASSSSSSSSWRRKLAMCKEFVEGTIVGRIALLEHAVRCIAETVARALIDRHALGTQALKEKDEHNASSQRAFHHHHHYHASSRSNSTYSTDSALIPRRSHQHQHQQNHHYSFSNSANPLGMAEEEKEGTLSKASSAAINNTWAEQEEDADAYDKERKVRAALFVGRDESAMSAILEACVAALAAPSIAVSVSSLAELEKDAAVSQSVSRRRSPAAEEKETAVPSLSPLDSASPRGGACGLSGCYSLFWGVLCQLATTLPATTMVWSSHSTDILSRGAMRHLLDVGSCFSPSSRDCLRAGSSLRKNKYLNSSVAQQQQHHRRNGGGSNAFLWATRHSQHIVKAKQRFVDLLPFIRFGNSEGKEPSRLLRALICELRWFSEASLALQWFTSAEYKHRAALSILAETECEESICEAYTREKVRRRCLEGEEDDEEGKTQYSFPSSIIDDNVLSVVESQTYRAECGTRRSSSHQASAPCLRWCDIDEGEERESEEHDASQWHVGGDGGSDFHPILPSISPSVLHIAALHGHDELIAALLITGQFGVNDRVALRLSHRFTAGNRALAAARPPLTRNVTFTEAILYMTPLQAAVVGCHSSAVRLLLAVGADPTLLLEPFVPSSQLSSSAPQQHNDEVSALHIHVSLSPRISAVHVAAVSNDVETLGILLEHPSVACESPLSHRGLVRLADAGDCGGNQANDGITQIPCGVSMRRTPMHYACAAGAWQSALMLLRYCASSSSLSALSCLALLRDLDASGDSPLLLAARGGHGETIMTLNNFVNELLTDADRKRKSDEVGAVSGSNDNALLFARSPQTNLTIAHCCTWWTRNESMAVVLDTLAAVDADRMRKEQQRRREEAAVAAKAAADELAKQRQSEARERELASKRLTIAAQEEAVLCQLEDLCAPIERYIICLSDDTHTISHGSSSAELQLLDQLIAVTDCALGGRGTRKHAVHNNVDDVETLLESILGGGTQGNTNSAFAPLPLDLTNCNFPPIAWAPDAAYAVVDALLPCPAPVVAVDARANFLALLEREEAGFSGGSATQKEEDDFEKFVNLQKKRRAEALLIQKQKLQQREENGGKKNKRRKKNGKKRKMKHSDPFVEVDEESAEMANLLGMCLDPSKMNDSGAAKTSSRVAPAALLYAIDLIVGGDGRGQRSVAACLAANNASAAKALTKAQKECSEYRAHHDGGDSQLSAVLAGVLHAAVYPASDQTTQKAPTDSRDAANGPCILFPFSVPSNETVWAQIDAFRFIDYYANPQEEEVRYEATTEDLGDEQRLLLRQRSQRRRAFLETRAAPIHYARANHNTRAMRLIPPSYHNTVTVLREAHFAKTAKEEKTRRMSTILSEGTTAASATKGSVGVMPPSSRKSTANAAAVAATVPTELMVCYSSVAIAAEEAAKYEREEAARRAVFFPQTVPFMTTRDTHLSGGVGAGGASSGPSVAEMEFISNLTSDAIAAAYAPPPPPPPPPLLTWPGYYGKGSNGVFKALGLPHEHIRELTHRVLHGAHHHDTTSPHTQTLLTIDALIDANVNTSLAFLLCRGDTILGAKEREEKEAQASAPPGGDMGADAKQTSPRGASPTSDPREDLLVAPSSPLFNKAKDSSSTLSRFFVGEVSTSPTEKRMSDMIANLIALTPNVNAPLVDRVGTTMLMIAAYHGQTRTVNMLLDLDADVAMTGQLREPGFNGGITALTACVLNNHTELAATLLERGADPNVPDECGNTPLHHAAQKEHLPIVKLLLRYGALTSLRNHAGHTAEDVAVGLRSKPLMRTLFWWRMAHAAKAGRSYPVDEPCDTARDFIRWLAEATVFYKRLDTLHEDFITLRNTVETNSVAVICYDRICSETAGGTAPMRSIIKQLSPYWFPDEIRRLELSGIFWSKPTLETAMALLKILPRLETLEFEGCSLNNAQVAVICTNLIEHPNIRRLNFSLNKYISKAGALKIEELLRANPRIIEVVAVNTGLDPAAVNRLVDIASENKRTLALAYNELSYPTGGVGAADARITCSSGKSNTADTEPPQQPPSSFGVSNNRQQLDEHTTPSISSSSRFVGSVRGATQNTRRADTSSSTVAISKSRTQSPSPSSSSVPYSSSSLPPARPLRHHSSALSLSFGGGQQERIMKATGGNQNLNDLSTHSAPSYAAEDEVGARVVMPPRQLSASAVIATEQSYRRQHQQQTNEKGTSFGATTTSLPLIRPALGQPKEAFVMNPSVLVAERTGNAAAK